MTAVSNFDRPAVVADYAGRHGLPAYELHCFEQHIPRDSRILDLGVGAGRTTPFLLSRSSRYLGVDISPRMVEVCRERFPAEEFRVGNACDLSAIAENSFDVVVISMNSIDYIATDADRGRCLSGCHRVLAPGGSLVFSMHNALRLVCYPEWSGVSSTRRAWRLLRSAGVSLSLVARVGLSGIFTNGHGYMWEASDDGAQIHLASPAFVAKELSHFGFDLLETVSFFYPHARPSVVTPWYYYAARRR